MWRPPRVPIAILLGVTALAACGGNQAGLGGGKGGDTNAQGGAAGGAAVADGSATADAPSDGPSTTPPADAETSGHEASALDGPEAEATTVADTVADLPTASSDRVAFEPGWPVDAEPPACAGAVHGATLMPADLLLLLDTSGSMEESAGTQSKWATIRNGLQAFFADPRNAGLGVGIQFFPPPAQACAGDGDCGGPLGACQLPGVCGPPATVTTAETLCNAATTTMCDQGSPCTAYGVCSSSGLRCTNVGQPCAGMAGDTCVARARTCDGPAPDSCSAAHYANPAVAIAALPGAAPALAGAVGRVQPQGSTPTTPAATGALTYLRGRAAANPGRKQALVLVTDGLPTGCDANTATTAVAALAAGQAGSPPVPTYVIGVFAPSQQAISSVVLQHLAIAGGTGVPFLLDLGSDLAQKLVAAMNQIRADATACAFAIPPSTAGPVDFAKINVSISGPGGVQNAIYVERADQCDPLRGGWYYDVLPSSGTPTQILLCPATCSQVKAGAAVDVRFGCKTKI